MRMVDRFLGMLGWHSRIAGQKPVTSDARKSLDRALALALAGKSRQAMPYYEAAVQAAPHSFDAWFNKSVCHRELKEHEKALACLERCQKLDSHQGGVWVNKGVSLGALGRKQEEKECYDRALACYEEDDDPLRRQGQLLAFINKSSLLMDGDLCEEALQCLDSALRIDPGNKKALLKKGQCCLLLGRRDDAVAVFEGVSDGSVSVKRDADRMRVFLDGRLWLDVKSTNRNFVHIDSHDIGLEVKESPIPVFLVFWAPNRAPSVNLIIQGSYFQALEELAGEYVGRIKVAMYDVDADRSLPNHLKLESIPFTMIAKGGKYLDMYYGSVPKEELRKRFEAVLSA